MSNYVYLCHIGVIHTIHKDLSTGADLSTELTIENWYHYLSTELSTTCGYLFTSKPFKSFLIILLYFVDIMQELL